jgi:hypothetical protein
MNNPENYPWTTAYVSAALETDVSKMIGHIAEAERVLTDLAYSWQPAYTAATSETDSAILCDRIKEALEVMQARAYAVGIGSPEYHALQDAKHALGTLNAERADGADVLPPLIDRLSSVEVPAISAASETLPVDLYGFSLSFHFGRDAQVGHPAQAWRCLSRIVGTVLN